MTRTGGTARITAAALAAALIAAPALADAPTVATDIPPVHSLVARIMQGVGEPVLVLPPGTSPHGYAMRPSEAAALADADLVVWTGPALTPWLDRAVASLAAEAESLELLDVPGTVLLGFREGATFEPHDHAHETGAGGPAGNEHRPGGGDDQRRDGREHAGDGARAGHGHDAGDDAQAGHGHDRSGDAAQAGHGRNGSGANAQAGHGHGHSGGDAQAGHGHGHSGGEAGQRDHAHAAPDHGDAGVDPHAWLDPENAKLWLGAVAEALAGADPENAATYRQNAAAGQAEIDALSAELNAALAKLRDRPFVVFHDAYHYFERRFGVEAAGAIALADGSAPGPARIAAIRQAITDAGALCVFAEPQFPAELIATVTEGSHARAATLDPVGAALPPGPALYPQLLRGLADSFRACLDPAA